MYDLVLVEDEIIIRKGLESIVDWGSLGFRLVGSVEDGQEGMDLIRSLKPHVILTDIRMPNIDGLKLLEFVKKEYPDTEVILISGYNDFEYAKRAIEFGAAGYILKASIDDEIKKLFLKIKKKLDLKYQSLPKLLDLITNINKAPFLDLIKGIYSNVESLGVRTFILHFNNVLTNKKDENYNKNLILNMYNQIKDFFRRHKNVIIDLNEYEIVGMWIDHWNNVCNPEEINSFINDLIQSVKSRINERINLPLTVTVGQGYRNIADACKSYQEARNMMKYRAKESAILYYDYYENMLATNETGYLDYTLEKGMAKGIELGNADKVEGLFRSFQSKMTNMQYVNIEKLQIELAVFLTTIYRMLSEDGINMISIGNEDTLLKDIYNYETVDVLLEWYRNILEDIIERRIMEYDKFSTVKKAIFYIQRHFHDDITLKDVAGILHINSTYLSSLFKKETGKSFRSYLIDCRINKAKELFKNHNLKVYEVAKKVGFRDDKQFIKMFKKETGLPPTKFIKLHQDKTNLK